MGVQVTFDLAAWRLAYPQFAAVTDAQITGACLPLAEIYCRNDGGGPVSSAAIQTTLLNLMVAHICQLMFGTTGTGPSGIVGRISSATEGSVSVASEFPTTPNNAFFLQTGYGAAFWAATSAYRTARYLPGPRRSFGPYPFLN